MLKVKSGKPCDTQREFIKLQDTEHPALFDKCYSVSETLDEWFAAKQ